MNLAVVRPEGTIPSGLIIYADFLLDTTYSTAAAPTISRMSTIGSDPLSKRNKRLAKTKRSFMPIKF